MRYSIRPHPSRRISRAAPLCSPHWEPRPGLCEVHTVIGREIVTMRIWQKRNWPLVMLVTSQNARVGGGRTHPLMCSQVICVVCNPDFQRLEQRHCLPSACLGSRSTSKTNLGTLCKILSQSEKRVRVVSQGHSIPEVPGFSFNTSKKYF